MADVAHRLDSVAFEMVRIDDPSFPHASGRSQDQGMTPNVRAICLRRDRGERSAQTIRESV